MTPLVRLALAAALALSAIPGLAKAADSDPAIAEFRLGMPLERARGLLKAMAGASEIHEVRNKKAEGTGEFVRTLYAEAPQGKPDEKVAVVFSEFGGRILMVMRTEKFADGALPGLAVIRSAVETAYGAKLEPQDGAFVAIRVRDKAGAVTDSEECTRATVTTVPSRSMLIGIPVWQVFPETCGVAVGVVVRTEDGSLASAMEQRMVDTQALRKDLDEHSRLTKEGADQRAKAEADRAAQAAGTAPRL